MNRQTSLRIALIVAAFGAVLTAATASHAAVTISTDATKNENCSGGVCSPTDKTANLNVGDLQAMLASSDVTVKTGSGAISIGVATPLTWTSTHRLTLDSVQFIHVKAAVVVEGTGALTLTTNDGGTGGDLVFENGGYANFWDLGSSLVINGANYALVSDINTLASDIGAHPSRFYALSSDYDASHDRTYSSSPVATVFTGTFEGLGHTISNVSIKTGKDQSQTGLFAALGSKGKVRDIALVNANVIAKQGEVAALVAHNDGAIINAYTTGSVSVPVAYAGGLAGSSTGTIVASYSTADVGCKGDFSFVGGLVGLMEGGRIERSHASGAVKCDGHAIVGGLVGAVQEGKILNSFATGATYSFTGQSNVYVGGLAGMNHGTITSSFATGAASASCCGDGDEGSAHVGGLAGENSGAIRDSYAIGSATVDRASQAGGLVGVNEGPVATSYSTGFVQADGEGGLLGSDYSSASKSYWDLDTSGIDNPHQGAGYPLDDPGITGLTDAQLKSALPAGFDPAVWGQDPNINNGWPYLLANLPVQAPAKKRVRK